MANQFGTNPWVLDTPGATILCATEVKVRHFEFSKYVAQGNKCTLQNVFGKIIWDVTGAADLEEVRSAAVGEVNGLVLSVLDAGVCRVYFE